MAFFLDGLSWLFLIGGSIFVIIGAFGMLRLPDFYSRLHPAGLTDTMGAGLILIGLLLQSEAFIVGIKLVIIAIFLLFTSPTSGHATARAALAAVLPPWRAPEEPKKQADEIKGGKKDGAT